MLVYVLNVYGWLSTYRVTWSILISIYADITYYARQILYGVVLDVLLLVS
jgi:hypothetical protein